MNAKTPHPAIGGNWVSLLLPIAADDSIEFDKLGEEIDILIDTGVDGIYSNGTAGEFHNQTEVEFDCIQAMLAERCKASSTPFVIGACQPDPLIMLNRVRRAAALDPRAIQVILPDWWPLTTAEAIDFLKRAAEVADGIPLILYNPPHAKRVLAPKELSMVCAAVPEVIGIKLADGDGSWYAEARLYLSGLSLFVPGHHLATGTKEGVAAGSFSNVACLSPRGAQTWTVSMRNDIDAALDLERRICTFMDAHIVPFRQEFGYSNAALDKLLSAIGNWGPVGTRLRFPYRSIDMAEAVRLGRIARSKLPDLFP
ncbi:dihydrodipicolinate synthase family protein (plasmid) [Rhizobium leguminosarum]|uniref:Dihydrodipicolinate synthase family protein n=1 Tax=Rhizobium beringeri TaxID=3019934 RepID=A0ABY1XNK9_9HYPH|nr:MULTISPECIES: dihydrodipicolinate synthase family protein [Rhizobium]TBC67137.1 dihydrodipicolinate synthase family protein [Rhizobium leguminosarum]TBC91588.1 dihydrodipicolinate synthase family protein [Rhizobium leguminosarum]TBE62100.1 dihydrodipicolinate synthase family protein [Rhizobium beringeri]WSH30726.1 dihydrodipicolinate synthase family protein [Rhizobium beringeri]WSH84079.1 dihydrodipicolinate synthase family protein [Rhizobium beringeri]